MYDLIVLAARPSDWTHEQFIAWWRGEHADVTYPLPGLRRWLHTDLEEATDPRSAGWDGMSVLSFDSAEALQAALASEEWRAAVAHVGDMRGRRMIFTGHEMTMVAAAGPADPVQAAAGS
jgi:uncharacterized protein (TIGR02118 family)